MSRFHWTWPRRNRTVCAVANDQSRLAARESGHLMSTIRVLLVGALVITASLVGVQSAGARSSGCTHPLGQVPCLRVSPAAGPIGTTVQVRGQVGSKYAEWRHSVKSTPFIELDRPFPDGCGGEGGTRSSTIHVTSGGAVTGSFVVTSRAHCFQTDHYHAMTPGLYQIIAGCLTSCQIGTFRVTATGTGALASTGRWTSRLAAIGVLMVIGGVAVAGTGRRRTAK